MTTCNRITTSGHALLFFMLVLLSGCDANHPPLFTDDMTNHVLREDTAVGTVVYTLKGVDPENSTVKFGLSGTDRLTVNATTGEVTLVKPLDREVNDTLHVVVSIEDEVGTNHVDNTVSSVANNLVRVPVSLIITDVNDNPPTFQNTPYEVAVAEDTAVGTTVFWGVTVTDPDLAGSPLEVNCSEDEASTCQVLSIVSSNSSEQYYHGVLVLATGLDYHRRHSYHLRLTATDGDHETHTIVEVAVTDVQNSPPVFTSHLMGVVQEDAPIGTLVMTVVARDGDTASARNITYHLTTNPQDYFLLDAVTGELRTAKPLDKESLKDATGVVALKITAQEVVEPGGDLTATSSVAEATVTIRDVNDEPPRFNQREYAVEIPENLAPDTPLPRLDMSVSDPDVGSNSVFRLRLVDVSGVFAVEPSHATGSTSVSIRITNGTLDYENPNQRKFIILVVAEETETSPQLSSTATITVSVTDVNDNAPYFDAESVDRASGTVSASVSELATPGQLVISLTARDDDSGPYGVNSLVYSLEGSGAERFSVSPKTGVIVVGKCDAPGQPQCLDFETKPEYHLTYKATDREGAGLSTQTSLRITLTDANDNPPVFLQRQYTTAIDEGATKFPSPLILEARDADVTSQVEYSIVSGNADDVFSLDPHSGELTVGNPRGVDVAGLTSGAVTLLVQASDGKYSDNATVVVAVKDVNNHKPRFDQDLYEVTIAESAELGSPVVQVGAHDADSGANAVVRYRIQKGGFDDFTVDKNTGHVTLANKLDYDRHAEYTMEVVAYDEGFPPLTGTATLQVRVADINDKLPRFTPATQRAEVTEDTAVGTVVHVLKAHDPDSSSQDALRYSIKDPVLALDSDGKELDPSGSVAGWFKVDSVTGNVFVAQPLRREVASVVTLTITVTDSSAPALQEATGNLIVTIIDVNDHAPTFMKPWTRENPRYSLDVVEGQEEGTVVATLLAKDEDSTISKYEIRPVSEFFTIDAATGVLRLKKELDYEREESVNLTVWAVDSGLPRMSASADVIVNILNINDNEPVFSQSEYQAKVAENSPAGTLVTTVHATDADKGTFGQVSYSLVGEHSTDFTLGQSNGELRVSNPAVLDREEVASITVQVMASDGAAPDSRKTVTAPVHIDILDLNDNAPRFSVTQHKAVIVENIDLNPPAKIVQVYAHDPDQGPNGTLRYSILSGNVEDVFRIDVETGILYPSKPLTGQPRHYYLLIEARDALGLTDNTSVEIEVLDVNLNKPVFIMPASPNATVEVPENAGLADYLVMTVKAKDIDSGDNGRVTYHLRVNDSNQQQTEEFVIHPETGELRTRIILDREVKAKYELILVARDHGSVTSFETLRYLTVLLVDTNDNEPEFDSERYEFSVAENGPARTLVGKVQAVDRDEGRHARIFYTIVAGNEEGAFTLDRTTGELYSTMSFDRETQEQYQLYVRASNDVRTGRSGGRNSNLHRRDVIERERSMTRVRIVILDENDNPPRFDKQDYYVGIKSLAAVNEELTKLEASDPDLKENGTVQYYIAASNLYKSGSSRSSGSIIPSPFNMSSDGRVTTASYMAEYNQDRFILEVVAREVAYPQRQATARVHVWVLEPSQLIRVILSRPPEEVHRESDEVVAELSNATRSLVVVDDIRYHVDNSKELRRHWTDVYLHVVNNATNEILDVDEVLKMIDSQYDILKDYYTGFAIENVVPAVEEVKQDQFDPALAALIALAIVLSAGCVTFVVVCCCLRHWVLALPVVDELKKKDGLIKKAMLEETHRTENPLWMEHDLKLYEEQELTMHVFTDPGTRLDMSPEDNTYATIQHPHRRNSDHGGSAGSGSGGSGGGLDIGDYETLTGAHHRAPHSDHGSMRGHHLYEAALGFHGSTFQAPAHSSDTTPELIAELL